MRAWPELRTLVLGSLLLASCDNSQQKPAAPPPPQVSVAKPLSQTITDFEDFTGRFEATAEVEVRARVSGYLQQVAFKDGALVEKGQLLFVIDPRPYEASLKRAQADLARAEAKLALAGRELGRAQALLQSGNISASVGDQRTQARRDAEAEIQSAKAQIESDQLNLEFSRVTAPIAGRISRKLVSEGNLVGGDTGTPTLLTTIVSQNPIHFYFDVDERTYVRLARLRVSGQRPSPRDQALPVNVLIGDETQFIHPGTLDFIDNRLDRASATLRSRALIDNPDGLFQPGQFGRIRIPSSPPHEALLVPEEAVASDQSRKILFVVGAENKVETREVRLGQVIDGGLRVVLSGVTANDLVVIGGLQRVRGGATVTPAMKNFGPKAPLPPAVAVPPIKTGAP